MKTVILDGGFFFVSEEHMEKLNLLEGQQISLSEAFQITQMSIGTGISVGKTV